MKQKLKIFGLQLLIYASFYALITFVIYGVFFVEKNIVEFFVAALPSIIATELNSPEVEYIVTGEYPNER